MLVTIEWGLCVLIGMTFCVGAGYFAAWRAGERRIHLLNQGWVDFLQEQQARWKSRWRDASLDALAGRDTEEMQATPMPPLTLSRPLSSPLAARPSATHTVPRPPISHPLRERR